MGIFKKILNAIDNGNKTKENYFTENTDYSIKTIKFLGLDMISAANSGHPGIVLGAAPIMYSLFRNHITVDVNDHTYFNRDRFILSAGHGSALLYSTMLVSGYKSITIEDIKNFRQIGSKTPGHPENFELDGVEATTGPLGQGVSMAVGSALCESFLAAKYNFEGIDLINHYTYVLAGDGCLQEGVALESIQIAGRFKLNKLIMLFDSNDVQLDGLVADSTNIDMRSYFMSSGWNHIKVEEGESVQAISEAIQRAKSSSDKPTVIEVKTIIGKGAMKQGTCEVHGSPISKKEIEEMKKASNYVSKSFAVENSVFEDFSIIKKRAEKSRTLYNTALNDLKSRNYALYEEFVSILSSETDVKDFWFNDLVSISNDATRNVSGKVFDIISKYIPTIIGGSADLSGSTKIKGASGNYDHSSRNNRNINYGVREFAMGSINNGIALHGGAIPIGATFFSFLDYQKAALRLAAIQRIRNIFIYTHDSVFLGEDGPTHQPIEQLWALRTIPNHTSFRPANVQEVIAAYKYALSSKNSPTSIVLSRLSFKFYPSSISDSLRGAYFSKKKDNSALTIIATGSEVALAHEVAEELAKKDIQVSVVSMPSVELFERQDESYRNSLLKHSKNNIVIEAGITIPWKIYTKHVIGIDQFGKSGSAEQLRNYFGFTKENVVKYILESKLI